MEYINKIELRGNVGSVRIADTTNGRVANFSLATNHVYGGKEETTWHSVTAWEKTIPDIDKITKGDKAYVCGRIRASKYTGGDGSEKIAYEVIASRLVLGNDAENV